MKKLTMESIAFIIQCKQDPQNNYSYRDIAAAIRQRYGIQVSWQAVAKCYQKQQQQQMTEHYKQELLQNQQKMTSILKQELMAQALAQKEQARQDYIHYMQDKENQITALKQANMNKNTPPSQKKYNSEEIKYLQRSHRGLEKKRIQLSLLKADYDYLVKLTEQTDTSIQHYIKRLIYKDLYREIKLLGNQLVALRQSNYELYKIGVNINQITKMLHQGDSAIIKSITVNKKLLETIYQFIKNHTELVKQVLYTTENDL